MTIGRRAAAAALLAGVVLLAGCAASTEDDELTPRPTRTTTATVPASPATETAVPSVLPVGDADLAPTVPVWVQGSVLHVGSERVDVSPRRVDSFVTTRGGVYFLDGDELWFTDLAVVRGTGLAGVSDLSVDRGATRVRLDLQRPGGVRSVAYDTTTGRAVRPATVQPATATERLGRPGRLALRSERSDVSPTEGPVPVRMGTGRFGTVDVEGGPLVAFDTTYDLRVPLVGVVGRQFELVRWTGSASFYGLALERDRPLAVLGCELVARRCTSYGSVDPDQSLLFESGS